MTQDEIIRAVELLSVAELKPIRRAVNARISALEKQAYVKAVKAAWDKVKNYQRGATLYFAFGGYVLDSNINYGEPMTVLGIKPRVRELWVEINKATYRFSAEQVLRFAIQPEKPEPRPKPDKATENMFNRIAKTILQ